MADSRTGFLKTEFIPFFVLVLAVTAAFIQFKVDKLSQPLIADRPVSVTSTNETKEPEKFTPWKAPDFVLRDLNGQPVSLSQFRGKIVFLNIWATWCKPCEVEMPAMERLHEKFGSKKFQMLTISIDKDGKKAIDPFIQKLNLTFPVLMDPESKVARQFKITGVPETFLIDPQGVVFQHFVGPWEWDNQVVFHFFEKVLDMIA